MVLVEVLETDEENQVDAVGSRLSVDVANAVVAVVSLAVRDGDDAGTETVSERAPKLMKKRVHSEYLCLFPQSVRQTV